MKWFNVNSIRTVLGALGGGTLAKVAANLSGCTWDNPATPIVEATTCAGSAVIPIQYQAIAGVVLLGVSGLFKALGKSGTVVENLAAPSVPMVETEKARPGVVTSAQVEASGKTKEGR